MICQWETAPPEIRNFVYGISEKTCAVIEDPVIGCYLHGSLAMGGFNPSRSDIDLIIVTEQPLRAETKRGLAHLFVEISKRPFPVELSILNSSQMENWKFPTPYDFHFSEYWRERYEKELGEDTAFYLNEEEKTDGDLAAHFMILNKRGICLTGRPIQEVFPCIPEKDYLSSILEDYEECLENIQQDPVYCILNLLRVFLYLKEEIISSKQEAGDWGSRQFPQEFQAIIEQARKVYKNANTVGSFGEKDLLSIRKYVSKKVEKLLMKRKNDAGK